MIKAWEMKRLSVVTLLRTLENLAEFATLSVAMLM